MTTARLRIHPVALNLFWVALALVDNVLFLAHGSPLQVFLATVGALGLLLRNRWPWLSFLLALPVSYLSSASIAGLVALYSVARYERRRWATVVAGLIFLAVSAGAWLEESTTEDVVVSVIYTVLSTAAPIALGLLAQTRAELTERLQELAAARQLERQQHEAQVLATERARIAREMHDVVSHQVSLIAVQAGVLQVGDVDSDTKKTAKTIRNLAVRTLDELRDMVTVLRATAGQATQLTPQPTIADLHRLIADAQLRVDSDIQLPEQLPASLQRAIYRTVQEGLTNIRKHAPGSEVTVTAHHTDGWIELTVENTAPTQAPAPLPSSGHGIIGLRERAELLDGTLTATRNEDGSHVLLLRLPWKVPASK